MYILRLELCVAKNRRRRNIFVLLSEKTPDYFDLKQRKTKQIYMAFVVFAEFVCKNDSN